MSDKKYALRKRVKSVRWMIFWVVLAQFAAEITIEAAVSFMANPPHRYIRIALVELIAIGIPISIYAHTIWSGKGVKKELCLSRCSVLEGLLAIGLGVSGQFVMMVLNIPANYLLTTFFDKQSADVIPVATQWYEIILGIGALVIVPAVLEEFWMRGIIFHAYSRCNTKGAVIFTGFIFALLHFKMSEFAGFLLMGITASIIMLKTKSLYAAMLYHAFSNLTALFFGAYIVPYIAEFLWGTLAIASVVFVALFMTLVKQKNKIKRNRIFSSGSLFITSILSLPVILSVVVVCVKFFLLKVAG